MLILKAVHVVLVLAALALALGPEVLIFLAARSGNARNIRFLVDLAAPLTKLAPVTFVLALAAGLTMAVRGGYDLLAPWLVASYLLFALALVVDVALHIPWVTRLRAAASASGDEPSAELSSALADRRGLVSLCVGPTVFVIITVLMVVKPA